MPTAPTALSPFSIYFFVQSVPFTRAVIEGRTSLGGSESACLGLAAALSRMGHDVHIFATQLYLEDADPSAYHGVQWHPAEILQATLAFAPPDVFISLRMPTPFVNRVESGLNVLWGEDMLIDIGHISGALPQLDAIAYVSEFHHQQWLQIDKDLLPKIPAYITKNGVDPVLIAEGRSGEDDQLVERRPHQFVHLSRPERGLAPLLSMWPAIRARIPDAELHLCRYDSMYDAGGWGKVCEQYDRFTAKVQETVGGIVMHGQLTKVELYRLLHQSALMLYPGVSNFGETSSIAVIEAQACGAVPICSYRGALPETLGPGAGLLIDGNADSREYQQAFVEATCRLVDDPARLAAMREAGMAHVLPAYTFDTLAAEWTAWITTTFERRYADNKIKVMRGLLHWDNHAAAKLVADEIVAACVAADNDEDEDVQREAAAASALCDRVFAQLEHTAADYALHAMDTLAEANTSQRLNSVADLIAARDPQPSRVLDVACGNGAMILCLCRRLPDVTVVGYDFSQAVLDKAWKVIQAEGFANRVELRCGDWTTVRGMYDVVFCGEFLEHVLHPEDVINRLEQHCRPSGRLHMTMPCGPFVELCDYRVPYKRSHVQAFGVADIRHLFGKKRQGEWSYLPQGVSPRGSSVGVWLTSWSPCGEPSTALDYTHAIRTTRPHQRVVASMIVKDGEEWIRKCLATVKPLVDDIVVLNTGTRDHALLIAKEYGAHVYDWAWTDDFSAARNESLRIAEAQYAADWVLWIDTDEHVATGENLGKYLQERSPFAGYVLQQHHLMLDSPQFHDVPCRVFRTGLGIHFRGVVHEQPEMPGIDSIYPSLECPDVNIVHYGYETEGHRRGKLLNRNLELLKKELRQPNPRELAWLLLVRELVTLASYEHCHKPQEQTEAQRRQSTAMLRAAITVYRERGFDDPAHKLHHLIVGSYQLALKWLGKGVEFEWAFHAGEVGFKGHPRPERLIAANADEARRLIDHRLNEWMRKLEPPMVSALVWEQARPADLVFALRAEDEPQGLPPALLPTARSTHAVGMPVPVTAAEDAAANAEALGLWLGRADALRPSSLAVEESTP
jgi:glycosyltransferase involved in cell wall biosynthesis/ubiquinone/menaquinone biosynthesis C-methylase UbiE